MDHVMDHGDHGMDLELPAGLAGWPSYVPPPRVLADAELVLSGAYVPLTGFQSATDADRVQRCGRLPDGTSWPAPVLCTVPAEVAAATEPSGRLVLSDTESVPVALLEVASRDATGDGIVIGGPLTALRPPTRGAFAALRRAPGEVRGQLTDSAVLAAVVDRPLLAPLVTALAEAMTQLSARLLILVRVAEAGPDRMPPEDLVRSVLAAAGELPDATVVTVPLARRADPLRDAALAAHVAAAYGATHVMSAEPLADVPVEVLIWPAGAPDPGQLRCLLDRPGALPTTVASQAVGRELRRWRPAPADRGFTLFFTGLSGSGKSTVARTVADALVERAGRQLTLLDGDAVRHVLSAGLGFAATDRDRNILRIGWVAAEISRHGGVAVCAPIAPYARTRSDVRRMVELNGDFVLVHVATPLEECERRDRKGLYAKARAGLIPEFTGISDPYEPPDDAELVIDTSTISPESAAQRVLGLLVSRGYLPADVLSAGPVGEDGADEDQVSPGERLGPSARLP